MYFSKAGVEKKTILSKLLIDYYKATSLLYGFSFFDSKIIEGHEMPALFDDKPTPRETYEIIALVDMVKNFQKYAKTIGRDNQQKLRTCLHVVDIAVFGIKHGNKYYKKIFKKYPSIDNIYYGILELREDLHKLNDIFNFISIRERIQKIKLELDREDFDVFLYDFEIFQTSTLAKKIEEKLFDELCQEEIELLEVEYSGIIDPQNGMLLMMAYTETKNSANGTLSSFSHYIYTIKYFKDILKRNKGYLLDIVEINNREILEKLFHLNNTSKRLNKFLENIAKDDLIKDIKSHGNEILSIIYENSGVLSEDTNNKIFAIFMILEIQQKLESRKEEVKSEVKLILDKKIPIEYRLTELELYIKLLIHKLLDNKKVVSSNDVILEGFYRGVIKNVLNTVNEVFNEYQEGNSMKEDEGSNINE